MILASKYANVPPWEFIKQPQLWQDMIYVVMAGEGKASRMKQRAYA